MVEIWEIAPVTLASFELCDGTLRVSYKAASQLAATLALTYFDDCLRALISVKFKVLITVTGTKLCNEKSRRN